VTPGVTRPLQKSWDPTPTTGRRHAEVLGSVWEGDDMAAARSRRLGQSVWCKINAQKAAAHLVAVLEFRPGDS
jgi:hypothetical protein